MESYSFCGLDKWISNNTRQLRYENPTKIQSTIIPHIINKNENLIAISKTGTGKTASFCLPILNKLAKSPSSIFAIILEPTRELALQVIEKLKIYSVGFNLRTSLIIGGENYINQLQDLDKLPHIIVATPGRLFELIEENKVLLLENVQYIVLDEFDQLLNKTMHDKVKYICDQVINNEDINFLMFSATYDNGKSEQIIKETISCKESILTFQFDDDVTEQLKIDNNPNKTRANITESYITVNPALKELFLTYMLKTNFKKSSLIIFVQTCQSCQYLFEILKLLDFKVSSIHSKLPQNVRFNELRRFRENQTNILVATDVACRGLDIQQVDYVVNYDVPRDPTDYVHRVGRCGRKIDSSGVAVTFVTQYDVEFILKIEEYNNKKLQELEIDEEAAMKELSIISRCKKMVNVKIKNEIRTKKHEKSRLIKQ